MTEATRVTTPIPGTGRRWVLRAGVVLVAVGSAVLLVRTWPARPSDLDRGRAALLAEDPAAARVLFDQFLAGHPASAEGHFRAAQAARQCGDPVAAARHLDRAADLGWDAPTIDLQRALMRAEASESETDEPFLLQHAGDDAPDAPEVIPVLLRMYAIQFRWPEADALSARWVRLRPESARAWARRSEVLERLRRRDEAIAALREAVRLGPGERGARLDLVRLLLETRQPPAEAAEHLDALMAAAPDDPTVLVQLALCRQAQGDASAAAAALDRAIALGTTDAKAFQLRGRMELDGGRPAAAVPFLRRAAEIDPSEPQTLYALFQALTRSGQKQDAAAAEARWHQAEADLKRAGELATAISRSPHDPELRREMGELFLRNGREPDGLRWLRSALREQPDHGPTHRALADYYERKGQPDLASFHRSQGLFPGPEK
jgi:tetratricopeptide (TPR) repeat protein